MKIKATATIEIELEISPTIVECGEFDLEDPEDLESLFQSKLASHELTERFYDSAIFTVSK